MARAINLATNRISAPNPEDEKKGNTRWSPPNKKPYVQKASFGPKKGHVGKMVPKNGSQSSQTGTYRKTEIIQSYLRTWGSH